MNQTDIINTSNIEDPLIQNGYNRDENLARFEIATLAILFLLTVVGNGIVLLALWTRRRCAGRKKLSRMYFFILHLCIADLVTAFLNVLPQLVWEVTFRFNGGFFLCKLVKFGQTLGPYLSSYILMATAIDRHQAICYPLTYCSWTSRRAKFMVWIAWIAAISFCLPQIYIFSYKEIGPNVYDCWATFTESWGPKTYVTWYSISVFIIPLFTLVTTYGCIIREIWRSAGSELGRSPRPTASSPSCVRARRPPLISRAKINTVKQTVAVIAMYVICSSPFITVQLWATWDSKALSTPFFEGAAYTILTLLSSLNSCVNSWIYLTFNRELPRLLLRHYTASSKDYHAAGICNSPSNSSCCVESTSLRPFSKWSLCTGSRSGRYPTQQRLPATSTSGVPKGNPIPCATSITRPHHLAHYNAKRWIVVTTPT